VRRATGARLRLLEDAPDFRLLFLATLASSLGTWLATVALVLDVYDRTSDARWVSALLIVEFLPLVVVGLLAGPLIDRLPRKAVLVVADLGRAAVFVAMPFAGSALGIVALAAAVGVATSFFRPAVYAGLPNVVADRDLSSANGLLNTADSATWAVGSLVGGVLVAASGPELAYWLNAATFVVSALLIVRIGARLEEERGTTGGHWKDLAEGFRVVSRSRPLVTVLVAWSLALFASAAVNVAEVALAEDTFAAGDFGYGLLLAATGIGLAAGSFAGGDWLGERGLRAPYAIAIGLMGGATGAAAVSPNVWVAAVFVLVSGFGNGLAIICNALIVQRGAADRLRGRVFTFVMSAGYAVLGLGMVLAGPLTNELGARAVWSMAASIFALAGLVGFALLGDEGGEPAPGVSERPQAL
jgi:MFS family permease